MDVKVCFYLGDRLIEHLIIARNKSDFTGDQQKKQDLAIEKGKLLHFGVF